MTKKGIISHITNLQANVHDMFVNITIGLVLRLQKIKKIVVFQEDKFYFNYKLINFLRNSL